MKDVTEKEGTRLVTDVEVAEFIEEALRDKFGETFENVRLHTEMNSEGHNRYDPWFSMGLSNGAQWQVSVKRYSWPDDGTSTQWQDEDDEEEGDYSEGGEVNGESRGDPGFLTDFYGGSGES